MQPIPDNVFIVAACNPHRGNSMASLGVAGGSENEKEKWVRGTYYVRMLHPTLRFLMWDYGSLDEHQEKVYINTKMKMLNKTMSNPEVRTHTEHMSCPEMDTRYMYVHCAFAGLLLCYNYTCSCPPEYPSPSLP